jgi:hypothetical protein
MANKFLNIKAQINSIFRWHALHSEEQQLIRHNDDKKSY